ncbi:hypothetical protein QTP70_009781 [Hemibagrus guttatus]|uniref:C-type lectin domain-containing protein n=1 Tax=Hemibagrus guttatus TaxID=175788 RepID=A0AAE0UPP7_9TELE|nr:hypothetical protein QTP70_009781 [Hemibagrus guttatus]
MGRGSPIPPMLWRKIVEQYQKGVSQRKIAKSLKLSSSTVHNIIQRFRESGTNSVRKGQGRKTILDARDLRALRRHCITYRNATVMEITTWAQEYFQKTLSVNTIHRAIRRCRLKLYRSKKKPYLNMIQKRRRFLWAKDHLKWTVAKWKTVLWSDESKFEVLFGKLGCHVIRTKEDKDNPSCYQRSVQKPASLMVWGCMSACGMGRLHIWKGTINAERYAQLLPCIFLQTTGLLGTAPNFARDFFYVDIGKTWLEAQRYCREKHTDLATVDNMAEMRTLIDQVNPYYFGDVWIGLKRGTETRWGWSYGYDTIQQYKYDGMIYSLPNKYNWKEAQEYCRWMYTDLVDIQNEGEQQAVLSYVSTDYMWIGLFSDDWKWSDEATSFFRYWAAGKPLSVFNISNCVVMQMNDNGKWDNSLCDRKLPFVCYKVTTPKKKQIVKIKVRSQGMGNLNDPSMKANILKKIEEMLTSKRMVNYTISWREKDGIVFHPESDKIQQKNMSDEL